jgi:hypothetical protein
MGFHGSALPVNASSAAIAPRALPPMLPNLPPTPFPQGGMSGRSMVSLRHRPHKDMFVSLSADEKGNAFEMDRRTAIRDRGHTVIWFLRNGKSLRAAVRASLILGQTKHPVRGNSISRNKFPSAKNHGHGPWL